MNWFYSIKNSLVFLVDFEFGHVGDSVTLAAIIWQYSK